MNRRQKKALSHSPTKVVVIKAHKGLNSHFLSSFYHKQNGA